MRIENILSIIVAVFVGFVMGILGFYVYNYKGLGKSRMEMITTNLNYTILKDQKTGVLYLKSRYGICVMVDADGKPMVEGE